MGSQSKLSVIIIHYNTSHYLKSCLDSLIAQSHKNIEIIFIDNNSPDISGIQFVRENYGHVPFLKIVINKENIGYARAANQGIRMAIEGKDAFQAMQLKQEKILQKKGHSATLRVCPRDFEKADYVAVTNPDIIYDSDYFKKAISKMEKDKKIAALTGKIYKYDFVNAKPTDVIDTVGLFAYKSRRIIDDGQGLIDEGQFNEECEVFGVSGACPLYRSEALKDVKIFEEYFDEDFFMYKEDVDLSWRFLLYGWKNIFLPEALAYHGRGTGVLRRFTTKEVLKNRSKLSRFQKKYSFRNQLLMESKNEMWGTFFRDFFQIVFRKITLFIYMIFVEPYLLSAYFQYLKNLPRALKKHKIIMRNKKISAKEMSKWFKRQSKYIKN